MNEYEPVAADVGGRQLVCTQHMAVRERLHLASFDGAWDPKVNRYHTTGFGGARELTPATPAVLSELGEKLLGLRPWE